jgi:hypothetical protein
MKPVTHWFRPILIGLALAPHVRSLADDTTQNEPSLVLPTMEIRAGRELPPPEAWRYAEIPGFEILSSVSDRKTQDLLRDFQFFNQAVGVVWPSLLGPANQPTTLILCGPGDRFSSFVPAASEAAPFAGKVSLFFRNAEHAVIILDLQAKELALADQDGRDDAAGDGYLEIDSYRQLYRDYVHSLLARRRPRLAAWVEEGLTQLLMGLKFTSTSIEFAQLDDPNVISHEQANAQAINAANAASGEGDLAVVARGAAEDRDFNASLARTRLLPLSEMFAVTHDSATARNPVGSRWSKQCMALVHLCLYQTGGRYQKPFMTYLSRTATEPATEKLFQECFGVSYQEMLLELRNYIDFTAYKSIRWNAKKGAGFPPPVTVSLRDATESEVGRIKGESYALANLHPAALAAFAAPMRRGERDPRLYAAVGLYEIEQSQPARARPYLEAATAARIERPRAYLELARLRFQDALARPDGPNGTLSGAQSNGILALLRVARTQPPVLAEVYELMSETLVRAEGAPERDYLVLLSEGVQRYPNRFGLIYQAAQLFLRAGDIQSATALVTHGLRHAPTAEARGLFSQLQGMLPAPAIAIPKQAPDRT